MNDTNREEKVVSIKSSVDFDIVADNMLEIAEFTVEKYEFRNDTTLSAEVREKAMAQIRNVLWEKVEEMKQRRKQILEDMFNMAEQTLDNIVENKD